MMIRLFIIVLLIINTCASLEAQYQVFSAGANTSGQLGIGSTSKYNSTLNPVGARAEWKSISAGENFTIAIKSDGTLWGWGNNSDYQLGNGSTAKSDEPVQIGTDNTWQMVSCGLRHTLALKEDGSLWAWGANNYGQLGISYPTPQGSPVRVAAPNRFDFIAAGNNHSLAVRSNNLLFVWGDNTYGQLGDLASNPQTTPMIYPAVVNIKTVRAGYDFSLILRTDGTLAAFGKNNAYQLGLGHNSNTNVPSQIGTSQDWLDIQAGYEHCIAIKKDSTLWAWGNNSFGQLGTATYINQAFPILINSSKWKAISAFKDHNIAVKADSTLWSWGRNTYGQLANGSTINQNYPAMIGDQKGWLNAAVGANATYAIKYYPQLTPPLLLSPADNYSDAVSSVTFTWLPVVDASKYEIQISTDNSFADANSFHSRVVVGLCSFTNNGFVLDETYFWRVRAINSLDTSNWSSIYQFSTEQSDLEMAWWYFSNTNNSAAIGIDTTTANSFRVNGRNFLNGDAIGIFYLDGRISKCAGYLKWDGTNFGFTVWGDDEMTSGIKEGLSIGESYTFKIWDSQTKTVYPAQVTYKTGYSSSTFSINGLSVITSASSVPTVTHEIVLDSGWNMISSYVSPLNTSFPSLISMINSFTIFAKDFNGKTYWKPYLQTLTTWDYYKAYCVKTNAKCTLNITGTKIIPQNTQVTLSEKGWHWIPYYRETSMNIQTALASIEGKFILVKDMKGNVYWPPNINTLSELTPGKGYMIYTTEAADLVYPENSSISAKLFGNIDEIDQAKASADFENTGASSVLKLNVKGAADNDIVNVYTKSGFCVGSAIVKDETAVISIWADDFLTEIIDGCSENEELQIKLNHSGTLLNLYPHNIMEISNEDAKTNLTFNSNEILTAEAEIDFASANELSFDNLNISPMPITNFADIEIPSRFQGNSQIRIYSASGEFIQEYSLQNKNSKIDFSNYNSGAYSIVLSNGREIISKTVFVVK